jgi:RimJ/RimL family protein N-acetyltransferase
MGEFRGVELDDLVIESDRLVLRPWRREDAGDVAAALADRAMHTYLALPEPYTVDAADRFIATIAPVERTAGTGLECAVIERVAGSLIGSATLRLPHRMRSCDIGYWIAPTAQGKGFATEATRALAGWAFARDVHRVELRSDVRNIVSARVALAAGFGFEGLRREALRDNEGRVDMAVFVRTAADSGSPVPSKFPALPAGGLSDGVLTLRSPEPGDIDGFAEQEADPLTLAVGYTGAAPPRAMMRRMLNRARLDHLVGPSAYFAMTDAASGAFAGTIRLRPSGPPNIGAVGYAVHPRFRGRGFAARALRLLSDWAFGQAGFARLELGARIDNSASQRAAAAAGFVADGIWQARQRNPDGTFSDEARYALIKPPKADLG